MLSENVSVDEFLFIGDSVEDQQAAKFLGIRFIGRQSDRCLDSSNNNIYLDFLLIKKYMIVSNFFKPR
jgi:phosphoglycolate phosphatase-like HAD superfamily hydrolase